MGVAKRLSDLYLHFSKWKFDIQELPPESGAILIGAPHTSNWDFALMLALSAQTGMKMHFLAKDGLFWWPLGPVLKALGGVPVDRDKGSGLVSQMAGQLRDHPGSVLALTPKGTRGKKEYWKSGFYRIATEADLPVLMGIVDSENHTVQIGPLLHLSGNVKEDMDVIREHYAGKLGVRPELTSEPRLRMENA